jgi:hypothetical protein
VKPVARAEKSGAGGEGDVSTHSGARSIHSAARSTPARARAKPAPRRPRAAPMQWQISDGSLAGASRLLQPHGSALDVRASPPQRRLAGAEPPSIPHAASAAAAVRCKGLG